MEPRKKRNAGIPKRYQGEMVLDDATYKSLIISQKNCSAPKSDVGLDGKNGLIKKEYPLANGPTLEVVTAPNIECIALGPTQFEIRFAEVPVPSKQSLPSWPKELDGVSHVLPCYVRLDRSEVTNYLLQQEEKKEIVLNSSSSSGRKRQVSCQRCSRTFTSRIQLKKHRCKRSAAPALCHFCDTSFVKTEDLIQHLLSCASFITPEPSPVNDDDTELYPTPSEVAPAPHEPPPSCELAPCEPPPPCKLAPCEPPPSCEFCLKTLDAATDRFVHYDICIPYHETRLLELWPRIQTQKTRKLVKTKYKRRKVKVPDQQNEFNAEEIDDETCVRVYQPSPVKVPKVTEDFYQSELRKAVESIASLEDSDSEELLPTYVLPGKRYLEITVTAVDDQSDDESGPIKKSSLSLADISDPDVVVVECPLDSEDSEELGTRKLESPTSTTADIPPTGERRIVSVAIKKAPRKKCSASGKVSSSNSDTLDAPESANLPHLSREVLRLCNKCCKHKHECSCAPVLKKKDKVVNLTLVKTKEKGANKKILSAKKKVSVLDLIRPSGTSKSTLGVLNQQIFKKYKK